MGGGGGWREGKRRVNTRGSKKEEERSEFESEACVRFMLQRACVLMKSE